MSGPLLRSSATGVGPIAEAFAAPDGATYQVMHVTLSVNPGAATSEAFTITLDADAGAAYDTLLYTLDLSVLPTTDLLWQPDEPFYIADGDALDVAWANTDGRTWGLLIAVMEV